MTGRSAQRRHTRPTVDTEPMRYPATDSFAHGLEVGDGPRVYWERVGNPQGKPAVVLHGGPGSGTASWWRTYVDPQRTT